LHELEVDLSSDDDAHGRLNYWHRQ